MNALLALALIAALWFVLARLLAGSIWLDEHRPERAQPADPTRVDWHDVPANRPVGTFPRP